MNDGQVMSSVRLAGPSYQIAELQLFDISPQRCAQHIQGHFNPIHLYLLVSVCPRRVWRQGASNF